MSQRDWDDAHLINIAREIHADDLAFGYRFIAGEQPDRGITASENRVARLCSRERIWSVSSKRRGLNRKAGPPIHDDLVDCEFTAQAADELWLTDIPNTAPTRANCISARSRTCGRIGSSATRSTPGSRPRWRCPKTVRALSRNELRVSMGRVGAYGDNAAMESSVALLQKNVLDRQQWSTREQLRLAIVTWIEKTSHRKRRLVKLTPSNLRQSTGPHPRPESLNPTSQLKWGGAVPHAYMRSGRETALY